MSDVILGNGDLKLLAEIDSNFIINQNGTDKINSKSENRTTIKVNFAFYWVSDIHNGK